MKPTDAMDIPSQQCADDNECAVIEPLLAAREYGPLSRADRKAVAAHLAICARCMCSAAVQTMDRELADRESDAGQTVAKADALDVPDVPDAPDAPDDDNDSSGLWAPPVGGADAAYWRHKVASGGERSPASTRQRFGFMTGAAVGTVFGASVGAALVAALLTWWLPSMLSPPPTPMQAVAQLPGATATVAAPAHSNRSNRATQATHTTHTTPAALDPAALPAFVPDPKPGKQLEILTEMRSAGVHAVLVAIRDDTGNLHAVAAYTNVTEPRIWTVEAASKLARKLK